MIRPFLLSFLLLQGCATAYDEIFVLVKNQSLGYPNQEVSVDSYEKAEFSFMTFKVGRNPKVKLVLSSIKSGVYEWVSSDKHIIHTYNGLIVKTSGLPHNINVRGFKAFDPINTHNYNAILEYDEPALAGISLNFTYSSHYEQNNTKIYSNIVTYAYSREADSIGWKAKDEYWYSNGLIIFSEQRIHPQMAKIQTEFFYKY